MDKLFSLKKLILYWLLSFAAASIFISFTNYKAESNDDSKYYTTLVERYQNAQFSELLTPIWGENYWGFDKASYMRDQFPGQLLMGVGIARLGIPADQALHILGMLFQIGAFLILAQIVQEVLSKEASAYMLIAILLTPLAFSYNIRANHELGIMFFTFLSLLCGFYLPKSWKWGFIASISCALLLLIKGPFFIFGGLLLMIGFLFSPYRNKQIWRLLLALGLCGVMVITTTLAYEYQFLKITGESFLKEFWKIQILQRAMVEQHKYPFVLQKLVNFYYYFSHYIAYSLPWSLIILVYVLYKRKGRDILAYSKTPLSLMLLLAGMSFNVIFGMSDRVAGRYTFPGYFLFSAWIALGIYSISPKTKKVVDENLNKTLFTIPLLWLLAFVMHFIF